MLQVKVLHTQLTRITFGAIITAAILFMGNQTVFAEELVVSGNGAGSTSQVSAANTQQTTINQDNTANTINSVQTSADTGNNSASGNTGENTDIKTGDVSATIDVENSGNVNDTAAGCCNNTANSNTTGVIAGNGTGTTNEVTFSNATTTTIDAANKATITNKISGTANTGNNISNRNTNGDVSIKTGNITVEQKITNGPLNINNAATALGGAVTGKSEITLGIDGNGSYSNNRINFQNTNNRDVRVTNAADILNESVWLLNTGYNRANDNNGGDVKIETGNISFLVDILNGPINVNNVEITCCEKKEEPKEPTGGVIPVTPPPAQVTTESKPSESKSAPGNGEVLAAAIGSILPITGNSTWILFLFGNVAMLFLGVILRLRSGRSPGAITAL